MFFLTIFFIYKFRERGGGGGGERERARERERERERERGGERDTHTYQHRLLGRGVTILSSLGASSSLTFFSFCCVTSLMDSLLMRSSATNP